jgi:prepilin-type N-terminal cleavage/methylation domain-containing protein
MRNQSGFTLIELMATVAIIGVLVAIAVPSYERYQARARQAEARVLLGSGFLAEKSFHLQEGRYTACLSPAGFNPSAGPYYTIGFGNLYGCESVESCDDRAAARKLTFKSPNSTATCAYTEGQTFFLATKFESPFMAPPDSRQLLEGQVGKDQFLLSSVGYVGLSDPDYWVVNENKEIISLGGSPGSEWGLVGATIGIRPEPKK